MKISAEGLEHLKRWEALRLEAYLPTPNDVWTIGYGHTRGVREGLTCIPAQAMQWLDEDADEAEQAVNRYVRVSLSQPQYDALAGLVFNIGVGAFRRSTLLQALNAGNYDRVPTQIKRWKYQDGEVLRGLVRRREAEAKMFTDTREVYTS
jgi:lysozyme